MLEGKAVIGETDMLQTMQQHALHVATKALDAFDITDSTNIACYIKKEFDQAYGPGWQCIVGMDFGSFITHCCGCFIYFCIGSLAIMLSLRAWLWVPRPIWVHSTLWRQWRPEFCSSRFAAL